MLIGNQYSDNKVYRGIRHYDSLPLTSGDIHEYSDTVYMKTAYIMNNLLGYGTLNTPNLSISSEGISLSEPVVVLIDGDVSLIQSDDGSPIINLQAIREKAYDSGVLCILGWYQSITANSTLRNYGGVDNSILPNDLLNEKFQVQLSSRYQFRWMPIILNTFDLSQDTISFEISDRDDAGNILSTKSTISANKKLGNVFVSNPPKSMSYALSELYIVPLLKYNYSSTSDSLLDASMMLPITPKGSSGFIKSETEPIGEYIDGTTWYNPITSEFKTYVGDIGFVDSASTMGFLQYQSVYVFPTDISTSQDISVPIDISEFQEGDFLQVTYEGLTLSVDDNYSIDYDSKSITLLGFTVSSGDKIKFTVTKIVEANNITSISALFTTHMATKASSTVEAHVRLSDDIDNNSGVSGGIAATPKAVRESRYITDNTNNTKYKFGVENGLLYIEEV